MIKETKKERNQSTTCSNPRSKCVPLGCCINRMRSCRYEGY
nr:MAG TPA: hypothetical protein [Caudoviricetes sp.]